MPQRQCNKTKTEVAKPSKRIRLPFIREEYDAQSASWEQMPRYPVADFSTLDVTIEFKQQSANMVTLSVSGYNAATETTISRRL